MRIKIKIKIKIIFWLNDKIKTKNHLNKNPKKIFKERTIKLENIIYDNLGLNDEIENI